MRKRIQERMEKIMSGMMKPEDMPQMMEAMMDNVFKQMTTEDRIESWTPTVGQGSMASLAKTKPMPRMTATAIASRISTGFMGVAAGQTSVTFQWSPTASINAMNGSGSSCLTLTSLRTFRSSPAISGTAVTSSTAVVKDRKHKRPNRG